MVFAHDFEEFPELTNSQLETLRFLSPHVQITEDFHAHVEKVHDGDTVNLPSPPRNFSFPLRLLDVDAPELSEGGDEARDWLKGRIEGEEVMVLIDARNRVGKYGRLLGRIMHRGLDVAEEMLHLGLVQVFGKKNEGEPEPLNKTFRLNQWF